MAETSGFFDTKTVDGKYDREYFSEQFAHYFALFIGNGVFGSPTNQLKVSAKENMKISVNAGNAFINGYWYNNSEEKELVVPVNATANDRVDMVVCRWDNSNRVIETIYVAGNSVPIRDGSYYDLKLAELVIPPVTSIVSDTYISDTRPMESVCGFVTGLLKVQTTEDLFAQYNALFNKFIADNTAEINEWFEETKSAYLTWFNNTDEDFDQWYLEKQQAVDDYLTSKESEINIWFEDIKDSLGTDPATSLQMQLDVVKEDVAANVVDIGELERKNIINLKKIYSLDIESNISSKNFFIPFISSVDISGIKDNDNVACINVLSLARDYLGPNEILSSMSTMGPSGSGYMSAANFDLYLKASSDSALDILKTIKQSVFLVGFSLVYPPSVGSMSDFVSTLGKGGRNYMLVFGCNAIYNFYKNEYAECNVNKPYTIYSSVVTAARVVQFRCNPNASELSDLFEISYDSQFLPRVSTWVRKIS